MQHKHYNLLGYLLTLIGYMTLTVSLPLISIIANNLGISITAAHYGVSILFFMFSLSAVILSSLADMLSAFVVLKYAQAISILGLLILCFCQNQTFFILGCFCIGAGTGCYASNARALISRHAPDESSMKKNFSNMSLLIILAPVLSFYQALTMATINWRLAYAVSAVIEITLAVYAYWVLSHEDSSYRHNQFSQLLAGFKYCLQEKIFFLNVLCFGIVFSVFMQLFMANIHPFLIDDHNISVESFDILLLFTSGTYMGGILLFKEFGIKLPSNWIRIGAMLLLLIGILIFSCSSHSLILIMLGMYVICAGLGFLAPFTTGSGMTVIKKHHGSAAALYTFTFACISGIWSVIQTHLMFTIKDFMNLGLWVSFAALLIFFVSLTVISKRNLH